MGLCIPEAGSATMKPAKQSFVIDICGNCNLKCNSCARGDSPHVHNPGGLMEPALLEQIVEKISREYNAPSIHLYNWGEPFLHPQLPRMIKIAKSFGAKCFLSANLNIAPNLEEALNANPYCIRVSVSGFSQQVYGRNHAGGNIETVKDNLAGLSAAIRKRRLQTQVHIFYLRFKYNLYEENDMRNFARKLGFGFHPVWALLTPAEKVLSFAAPDSSESPLLASDRQVIDSLVLPLAKALEVCRNYPKTCPLREEQIVLDVLGNVLLCCAVYDSSRFTIGSFLRISPDELQVKKAKHPFCTQCLKHGIHTYETYGAWEFDRLAAGNIDPQLANSPTLRWERFKKTVFHKIIPAGLRQQAYNLYARLAKY